MLKEEWRLHTSLFGGARFALFPVLLTGLVLGTVATITTFGVPATTSLVAMHVLVALFGLQTGSIVFLGEDALENLLGNLTLLVYSARTLPVSQRRLLGIFLIKDLVYYAGLFITPLTLGLLPLVLLTGLPALTLAATWLSLTLTFLFGMSITIIGVSLRTHRFTGFLLGGTLALLVGGFVATGTPLLQLTPYAIVDAVLTPRQSVWVALGRWLGIVTVVAGGALLVFEPATHQPTRTVSPRYRLLTTTILGGNRRHGIIAKTLVDLHRSSGGYLKLVFSAGILTVVTAYGITLSQQITGRTPLTGIAFGSVLGLLAFPVYNWITQLDAPSEYQTLPYTIADLFHAKRTAFLLLAFPLSCAYYGAALLVYGFQWHTAVLGAGLLVTTTHLVFAVTVYIAGYHPNEFLFDVVQFAKFTVSLLLGIVPVVVVGLFALPLTRPLLAGLLGYLVGANLIAMVVWRTAVSHWTTRLRTDAQTP